MPPIFQFRTLPQAYDDLAPDTSEIRLLNSFESGGLCHCTLGSGVVSTAVKHKTVSELWYCLSGQGEIWQSQGSESEVKQFTAKDAFTIPLGNSFQFRNTGTEDLCLLIATIPRWPGPDEAERAAGHWK